MTKNPIALTIALAFATSITLYGCDSTANLTEQEHIQRAKDFEDKGNLNGSIVELKNAVQKEPDSPQARLMLGQIYLRVGMGAEAEKELTRAEKLGVNRETIKPQLGEALLLIGEYKRVLDEVQIEEQTSEANRARILQLRADALLKLGQFNEACNLYRQSIDTDKANPATFWGLAQCAFAEQDMAQAREWLDAALKTEDRQAKTWILLGELEQLDKNIDGALAAFTNALKVDPANVEALQRRATLNTTLGKIEPARADIEQIKKLAPKSLGASYLSALLNFREGKNAEAREALQEALKISPNYIPALLLGGSIESALGNLQTAESHLNKVVRASPRNIFALHSLASVQLRLGRPDDAEKTLSVFNLDKVEEPGVLAVAGEIALAKKEYSKAAEYFEKASALSPESSAIRTELGVARLAQGDARAISDLQAAAQMDSAGTRVDSILIMSQLKQKQFDAALESIALLEKKQPQSPLPSNFRGAAYLGKNDTAKARTHFEQALKIDPKFVAAAINLAQLDLNQGETAKARTRFESVLKADPTNLQAMLALATLSARDKDEKAYLAWLEKAAKAHPQSLLPRQAMTRHLLAKGENNKSLAIAREAVASNPDNPDALNLLGTTQLAIGDKAGAIGTFTMLTKKASRSPEAFLRLAEAQIADKNLSGARATLQTALQLKPDHLQSQDALMRIEMSEGKPEAALQIARRIQTQYPRSPIGFDREGDIFFAQKRLPDAIKAYDLAVKNGAGSAGLIKLIRAQILAGNTKQAEQRVDTWLKQHPKDNAVRAHVAEYYLLSGRNSDAIGLYLEIQRQMPDDVLVLNNLATLYHREKDKRALPTAEKAFKLAPENPAVQDTLGWILVEQGQVARGLEMLRNALAKAPKEAVIRYHHAAALARAGKNAQARVELEELLRDAPNFPEADSARSLLRSLQTR